MRAEILRLLLRVRDQRGLAVLMMTHDLGSPGTPPTGSS
jgi:ABC-type dipeptide/oligopeptide/nickel transport system ATPase component